MRKRGELTNIEFLQLALKSLNDDTEKPWNEYPCLEWTRSISTGRQGGYGAVKVNGIDSRVHRVAWEIANGSIPDGLMVLHKCDNRPCFRPIHLFTGTAEDNSNDMESKGRSRRTLGPKGEDCGRSKLTEADVIEIRRLWSIGELSQVKIGKLFNVKQYAVFGIVHRVTWRHI